MWAVQNGILSLLAVIIWVVPFMWYWYRWHDDHRKINDILQAKGLPIEHPKKDFDFWWKLTVIFLISFFVGGLVYPRH